MRMATIDARPSGCDRQRCPARSRSGTRSGCLRCPHDPLPRRRRAGSTGFAAAAQLGQPPLRLKRRLMGLDQTWRRFERQRQMTALWLPGRTSSAVSPPLSVGCHSAARSGRSAASDVKGPARRPPQWGHAEPPGDAAIAPGDDVRRRQVPVLLRMPVRRDRGRPARERGRGRGALAGTVRTTSVGPRPDHRVDGRLEDVRTRGQAAPPHLATAPGRDRLRPEDAVAPGVPARSNLGESRGERSVGRAVPVGTRAHQHLAHIAVRMAPRGQAARGRVVGDDHRARWPPRASCVARSGRRSGR